jgi:DNA helicase HerA-like ATPase
MTDKERAFELLDHLFNLMDDEKYQQLKGTFDDEKKQQLKSAFFEEIEWHNMSRYFKLKGEGKFNLSLNDIRDTDIYKQCDVYSFPENALDKIIHFFYIQIIEDIYINRAKNDHIGPAINKLKSKTKDLQKVIDFTAKDNNLFKESNIVIIDLNESNIEIKKTIPLLLSSKAYAEHKAEYRKRNGSCFFNLIIDEAHNILSYNSTRESETWKDYRLEVFEEIIKEGRKFGVFLTIASQRPHDISSTIISQLHNYFLHRLVNNKDIEAIEKTISYLDKVSFDKLPILPTGSCIFAGLSTQIPIVINIDKIKDEFEPRNKTIKPTDFWN